MKMFLCTELLKVVESKMQLSQSVPNRLEGNVSLLHELELHCPIDWFVLMANRVYDYFKSANEFSVRFKASLAKTRDPSSAPELFQVLFIAKHFLCYCQSLETVVTTKTCYPNC